MERVFACLEAEVDDLFDHVEALDNQHRKNNIRIKHLKEHSEGNILHDLFNRFFNYYFYRSLMRLNATLDIRLDFTFSIGHRKKDVNRPREIIVRFIDHTSKCTRIRKFKY